MSPKIFWFLFEFSAFSLKELDLLNQDLGNPPLETSNKNQEASLRRHLAGRIALQKILHAQGLTYFVRPQVPDGFLELCDRTQTPVTDWFASISHSEEIAAAALGQCPVGIDVEKTNRMASRAISKIASASELERLDQLPMELKIQVKDPSLLLWSSKEAFTKALGLGLGKGAKTSEILLEGKKPLSAKCSIKSPFQLQDPQIHFFFELGSVITICSEKERVLIKLPLL